MTNGQQHIPWRHAAKLTVGVKIRGGGRLGMIDGCRAIDTNTTFAQLVGEGVQEFVGPVDCFLRPAAPLAAHVAVFRYFGLQRGFFGRDMTVICAAYNYVTQSVPFVPAFDFGFVR